MRSFRKAHRPNVSHLPPGARFLLKVEREGGATPHPRRSGGRDPKRGGRSPHDLSRSRPIGGLSARCAASRHALLQEYRKRRRWAEKKFCFFWGGVIFDKSMRCRFLFAKSHVLFHIRSSKRCETVTETTQHNTTQHCQNTNLWTNDIQMPLLARRPLNAQSHQHDFGVKTVEEGFLWSSYGYPPSIWLFL